MAVGLVFSGQGSQRPGMGRAWQDTESWQLVSRLSETTGRDLAELLLECGAEELARTDNAQLATFTLQMVVLDALDRAGLPQQVVSACAGHSLGEYSALCAAGIAPIDAGVQLVLKRGAAMLAATAERPGTMGVVLGLGAETLERITGEVRAQGPQVWVANVNAAEQVVVSGTTEGVAAIETECLARKVKLIRLPVGGAFHSPLMEQAAVAFRPALAAWEPHQGRVPVVSNVDARPYRGSRRWRELTAAQLLAPVQWEQSIRCLVGELGCTALLEIGVGSPLTNLTKRAGLPVTALWASSPEALPGLVEQVEQVEHGEQGPAWPSGPGAGAGPSKPGPGLSGPGIAGDAFPKGGAAIAVGAGATESARAAQPALSLQEPMAEPHFRLRGRQPYGYRLAVEGGSAGTTRVRHLTPDEVTAPVVQRIFRQFLDGRGLQGIAEGLTADAILCPSAHDPVRNPHHVGSAWSKAAVRSILVNPRYTGQLCRQPDGTVPEQAAYPPLAHPEQFDRVQQTFEAKRRRPASATSHQYLFRGLLRCTACGRLMQGTWNNGEPYYRCRFPQEYAAANGISHPRNVYLRERRLARPLMWWLGATAAPELTEACRTGGHLFAKAARGLRALPEAGPEECSQFYRWLRMRLTYSITEPVVRVKLQVGPQNRVIRGVVQL